MERHPLQALLDPAAYGERTTSVRLVGSQVPFSLRYDRAVFPDLARRREFPSIFFHATRPETGIMGRPEGRTDEQLRVPHDRMISSPGSGTASDLFLPAEGVGRWLPLRCLTRRLTGF
ncbi:MAG: hypothetical protein GYA56_02975 [Geobacteraceae bacterium]|nr:hypothetical protein [Geobacteraceae bacterium]